MGSFVGAVVEYTAIEGPQGNVSRDTATRIKMRNLDAYEEFCRMAVQRNAQMIVFPEYGVSGCSFLRRTDATPFLEELPHRTVVPCGDPSFTKQIALQRLSCMARIWKLVIVANLGTIQECSSHEDVHCPPDGHYQFNTLVALDENGRIVQHYHKTHLFFEPYFDSPPHPALAEFTTSFGVTFGMGICFDLMFPDPMVQQRVRGVDTFVLSSRWVNSAPYLTAVDIQSAWSRRFDATLLASNAGDSVRTSGSGIYGAGSALAEFFNPTSQPTSHLLVARVDTSQRSKIPPLTMHPWSPPPLLALQLHPFQALAGTNGTHTLVAGDVKCTVTYHVSQQQSKDLVGAEWYGIMAASGMWLAVDMDFCGIVRCIGNSSERCFVAWENDNHASTVFASFEVTAQLRHGFTPLRFVTTHGGVLVEEPYVDYAARNATSIAAPSFSTVLLAAVVLSRPLGP